MQKVLNQEEIDAMVRAARGGAADDSASGRQRTITSWNIREAGQIGRDQVQSISQLHEGFAKSLTNSLGAYLRIEFAAALVSAEHLTYGEFLQRVPEKTYLASCTLAPGGATALLQLDLTVALPLIDILLGGEGRAGAIEERPATVIEGEILETVVRIMLRELQVAWRALSLEFQFEQRRQPEQVAHLLSKEEKTLSLSFEITVAESRGTLNLMVPAVVSNALLRKISSGFTRDRSKSNPESVARLRTRMLQCPLRSDLCVVVRNVPVRDLAQLAPGGLLITNQNKASPAELRLRNAALFTAEVACLGNTRAALLGLRNPLPESRNGTSA